MNYNKSTLLGRLVEAIRFTASVTDASGKVIDDRAWGRLAVNRSFEKDSPYDVFNFVCWGMNARLLRDHSDKGKEMLLEGQLRTNNKKRAGGPETGYDNYTELSVQTVTLGQDSQKNKEKLPEKSPGDLLAEKCKEIGVTPEALLLAITAQVKVDRQQTAVQDDLPPGYPEDGYLS